MGLDAAVRFPAWPVQSEAGFAALRERCRDVFDERYRREQSLGTKQREIVLDGTCAVCLTPTIFRSGLAGGMATADGRMVPNWRESQFCGCEDRLNGRERALLHLASPYLDVGGWCRAAVLGGGAGFGRRLGAMAPGAVRWAGFEAKDGVLRLPIGDGAVAVVLCPDHLQSVPALDAGLMELARVLMPGGTLVFSVPLAIGESVTVSDLDRVPRRGGAMPAFVAGAVHRIGWDILERVRGAGFVDCTAYCHWSEELGYLGPYNLGFVAGR